MCIRDSLIGFGFLQCLEGLLLVGAHGDGSHIHVPVGHGHTAQILLAGTLAGGGKLGDGAERGGLCLLYTSRCV